MKIKTIVESFSAAYAKKWFKKNYPVFIATASYTSGGCLYEVHSMEKKTRELALADLKKELKSEGVDLMHLVTGNKNPNRSK